MSMETELTVFLDSKNKHQSLTAARSVLDMQMGVNRGEYEWPGQVISVSSPIHLKVKDHVSTPVNLYALPIRKY